MKKLCPYYAPSVPLAKIVYLHLSIGEQPFEYSRTVIRV